MTPRDLLFMRLRGILRKEVLQILRDPSSIALAIVLPLVLLFIFGYGLSLDAENVPVAVVLKDNGPRSGGKIRSVALFQNHSFDIHGRSNESAQSTAC